MYTREGDYQQASYRLCNLNPLYPILCALFIFIHIYRLWVLGRIFSMMHMKKKETIIILQLIKRMMLNFLDQLSIEKYGEGRIFLSVPSSAFELDRPENHVHTFLLEHTEYGFSFKS